MPSSPKGDNDLYYEVKVNCGSSKTEGLWDYNAWRLNLDYIESNSKCNLMFTSTMSKEEYDKYIQAGVTLRRNTYRGKDITDLWRSEELYKQIEDGTFADIYVGDYIKTNDNNHDVTWLIADLDYYIATGPNGENRMSKHHAVIIPSSQLGDNIGMNDTNTTGVINQDLKFTSLDTNQEHTNIGGYMGSRMKQETLPQILQDYIEPVFKNHIIEYVNSIGDQVENGVTTRVGAYKTKIDLMSEMAVLGSIVHGNSKDIGYDLSQYAIFRLKPDSINTAMNGYRFWVWLNAVGSGANFTAIGPSRTISSVWAAYEAGGVRPRFLID